MEQYIKKSALVAEIEKRIAEGEKVAKELPSSAIMGLIQAYKNTLSFIDTLEVKEVNFDESARYYLLHEHISPLNEVLHQADLKVEMQYHKDIEDAYKAGFELGLKAQKGE